MSAALPELRSVVMILVEVSWEDQTGGLQRAPARMEDKSVSGACIRLKTPIDVGSKVTVQWRFDQFTGITKYCRNEGREFVVGVQRDKDLVLSRPLPSKTKLPPGLGGGELPVSAATGKILVERQESKFSEIPADGAPTQIKPRPDIAIATGSVAGRPSRLELYNRSRRRTSRLQASSALRSAAIPTNELPKRTEAGEERKPMKRKWLDLAPWHNRQEGLSVSGNGSSEEASEKENLMPQVTQPTERTPVSREVPTFQVELLSTEEIYRAAGIVNPLKGYSVNKVVEMLDSEHIRGLSKEMKRAAVLMALDAAGVSVDRVRQDAKARQEALDAYEAGQKKQAEAEWARKAEEITQIQAELESIKAHYAARISRNMESIARDKSRFSSWVTTKQQEAQSMAEAVELCLKAPVAEVTSPPLANASAAAAAAPRTEP